MLHDCFAREPSARFEQSCDACRLCTGFINKKLTMRALFYLFGVIVLASTNSAIPVELANVAKSI